MLASRSFGRAVTNLDQVRDAVASHTARAAERMRRGNLATAEVVVFVHTNRFKASDEQYSASHLVRLSVATADTSKLIGAAMLALERIWRPGFRYAKAKVTFPELVSASRVQRDLWTDPDSRRAHPLDGDGGRAQRPVWPRHYCLREGEWGGGVGIAQPAAIAAIHDVLG